MQALRAGGKLVGLGSLEWGGGGGGRGEECVLTELNLLLTSTWAGRVVDLGCRRSLSMGWVVEFGYICKYLRYMPAFRQTA